jgi:hypothetical protein
MSDEGGSVFGNIQSRARNTLTGIPPVVFYGVAGIVIIIIAYYVYRWFKKGPDHAVVLGPYNLKGVSSSAAGSSQETIFDQSQLNENLKNNFTLSFFTYMNEVNAERIPLAGPEGDFRFKPLVLILGVGQVTVDPIHQKARITLQPLTDARVRKVNAPTIIDIDDFVVARWNQLTISVEGRSVDVYLNGNLIKSALMENVPVLYPVGLLLETVPDFSGQAGLFEAWPRRLVMKEVMRNYKRNVDLRGKPNIPEGSITLGDVWENFKSLLCKVGICGFNVEVGALKYIDYDFA